MQHTWHLSLKTRFFTYKHHYILYFWTKVTVFDASFLSNMSSKPESYLCNRVNVSLVPISYRRCWHISLSVNFSTCRSFFCPECQSSSEDDALPFKFIFYDFMLPYASCSVLTLSSSPLSLSCNSISSLLFSSSYWLFSLHLFNLKTNVCTFVIQPVKD